MLNKKFRPNRALALTASLVFTSVSLTLTNDALADSFAIEEIIVTAQKKAESSQDVPISMAVIGSNELEQLKLRNTMEIAAQIPNMMIISNFGDSLPAMSIRGVTQADYNLNQNSPIGMYVDEVYRGPMALNGMQMFDLDRLEVLRGPQGTLYGKNTTGGAVNFHTKTPDFVSDGYLSVGLGNYSKREVHGAYETPLIADKLAVRAAFVYNQGDGYVEHQIPGMEDPYEVDEWAGRVTVKAVLSDATDAVVRLRKSKSNPTNFVWSSEEVVPGLGIGFTGLNNEHLDFHETEANFVEERTMENEGISLTVNWDINDSYSLTSITAYDEGIFNNPEDADGTSISILELIGTSEVRQYTQELRISSSYEGPFNWIGGLFYGREENDIVTRSRVYLDFPFDPILQTGTFYRNNFTQNRDSYAVFAQADYLLTQNMNLVVGLRYSEDDSEMVGLQSVFGFADLVDQAFLIPPQPKSDFSDSKVTGRIALNYHWSDSGMAYISYNQGYRNGVFNATAFFSVDEITQADPEEIDAYEIGFKSQFASDRIQLNGAVFFYDYTDQQFIDIDSATLVQTVRNAGESEVLGFELELVALATEDLTLQVGLGYLDTEYKSLILEGSDLSGNKLINAPDWNFNLSLDYVVAETDSGTILAHLDTSYTDEHYSQPENVKRNVIESRWLTNLRLSWEDKALPYTLSLWVKNLADEEYKNVDMDFADGFNMDISQKGAPRTFGAEFIYRWE
jgi:iron complex outermembrane receptor protein